MSASSQQIIAGLYASFFNRAPDLEGFLYWDERAVNASDFATFNAIAAGFSTHAKFKETYDSMSNLEFVEAIYINTLGAEGDAEGISYWTAQLDLGFSQSGMVASFVYEALNFDANDTKWDSLSALDKAVATDRKNAITNKAEAGMYFVDTFGESTNIINIDDLDNDSAYQASMSILENVNSSLASVGAAKLLGGNDLFGDEYRVPFSTEFFSGKTFTVVFDDNYDGLYTDKASGTFTENEVFFVNGANTYLGTYEIIDSSIFKAFYPTANQTVFMKGFQFNAELNALEVGKAYAIGQTDNIDDISNLTMTEAQNAWRGLEYIFEDSDAANEFIALQLVGLSLV